MESALSGKLDKIIIEGVDFLGHCGAVETERNALQRFSTSIELSLDLKKAAKSGELHDTVDYAAVSNLVMAIGQLHSFILLESMAEEMANQILSQYPVKSVNILLKKCVPPVYAIRGFFAVSIYRTKP